MSLLSWLGRRVKLTDHSFWATFLGSDTWTGEAMSPTIAMQNSAFWSGIRLTAQVIGSLGMGLYQKQTGGRIEITDSDLYRILAISPDGSHSALEFWEGVSTCLWLTGNSFAAKKFGGSQDNLVGMELLNPSTMIVRRDIANGPLFYDYTDYNGRFRRYTEREIFHVRGFGICGDVGLSPIQYGAQTLSVARAAEKTAGKTFANGMRASGWLVSKNTLTTDQRELTKQNLIDPMSGTDNAGKIGLLEGDFFDFKQMSMPPEDAQLLESRAFGVEEVCRIIGIPPVLVGHASSGQTMWGSGISQIIGGWYTLGLRPVLRRIEKSITMQLIPVGQRNTIYAEFTVEELLRADPTARGEFYWKLMQVGAITPNQICDAENYPRFDGGDQHFANSTLAPIGPDGMLIKLPNTVTPSPGVDPNQPRLPPPNNSVDTTELFNSVENMRGLLRIVK